MSKEYDFTEEDKKVITLLNSGDDARYIKALKESNQPKIDAFRNAVKKVIENGYFEIRAESGAKRMSSLTIMPDGNIKFVDGTDIIPPYIIVGNDRSAECLVESVAPEYIRVLAAWTEQRQRQITEIDLVNLKKIEQKLVIPLMLKYTKEFKQAKEIVSNMAKETIISQIFNLELLKEENRQNLIKQKSSASNFKLREYAHITANVAAILDLAGDEAGKQEAQKILVTLLNLCLAADGNNIPELDCLAKIHPNTIDCHHDLASVMVNNAKIEITKPITYAANVEVSSVEQITSLVNSNETSSQSSGSIRQPTEPSTNMHSNGSQIVDTVDSSFVERVVRSRPQTPTSADSKSAHSVVSNRSDDNKVEQKLGSSTNFTKRTNSKEKNNHCAML